MKLQESAESRLQYRAGRTRHYGRRRPRYEMADDRSRKPVYPGLSVKENKMRDVVIDLGLKKKLNRWKL